MRIPVTRNFQGWGSVEIVFDEIAFVARFPVFIKARVETGFVRVDDDLPVAVEADRRSRAEIGKRGRRSVLRRHAGGEAAKTN